MELSDRFSVRCQSGPVRLVDRRAAIFFLKAVSHFKPIEVLFRLETGMIGVTMAKKLHLSEKLLHEVQCGEMPPEVLISLVREHLAALCPTCAEAMQSYQSSFGRQHPVRQVRTVKELGEAVRRCLDEPREIAAWVEELRSLPLEDRLGKIGRARRRFRGLPFVRAVLTESRACLPDDAAGSLGWALTAQASLERGEGDIALWALTVALQANARRVLNDRVEAGRLFQRSRTLLSMTHGAPPEIRGEISSLEASLAIDQHRSFDAQRLLADAAMNFSFVSDISAMSKVMMKLAFVYRYQGEHGEALACLELAQERIDPAAEPKLYLLSQLNRADNLFELGELATAQRVLAGEQRRLEEVGDPGTVIRVTWLQGRIASALGQDEFAEKALRAVRDAFAYRGVGFDVAMVSLDLAEIYHRHGRYSELRSLAVEMVALFKAQDVHREAYAALALFQDAAAREALTMDNVVRLRKFFQELEGGSGGRV